ncbi:MAG: histidine kinase [Deltaproteobacteria bacterium]|nr:histidine kinase [Deltaproteobacteria bacterium]
MPLFMDRHDVRDATAEAVAAAHQQDLRVQAHHTCKTLTYWFDEKRGTAFCLIEAPTAAAVHAMHREAHGLIPNMIIEVQPSTVESFLGRITDAASSATQPIREAGFRALMFTDMANSTQITNVLGDTKAQVVFTKHHETVRQALLAYEGREVDRAGDGFLICFASVSHAVMCAVTMQRAFHSYNSSRTLPIDIHVRIGLGAGEPLADGDDLFGSAVNLTARICATAAPSQVLAARVVRDLCSGKSFTFRRYGEVHLKGFPDPVELYEVDWAGQEGAGSAAF